MALDAPPERRAVLSASHSRHPRGTTLVELVVALTLGAIVLGTAAGSVVRQQHGARRVVGMAAGAAQSRAVSSLVPAELADLVPSAGDLVAGQARDTALQLRVPIATGVSCDSAVGRAILMASDGDELAPAGGSAPPRAGDSLWWYTDAALSWRGRRIADVHSALVSCSPLMGGQGTVLQLALADLDTIPIGALLRVTRPFRYVIYRSGDGSWQLGLREWSETTQRFAPPQPIAGPFARRLGTGVHTGFRYFDAEDWELPVEEAGAEVGRIARIRITAIAVVRRALGGADSLHVDSADVALHKWTR
jgi:type II secretory pathway pseudopilin PulG